MKIESSPARAGDLHEGAASRATADRAPDQQASASEQRIVPVILSGGGGSRLWPLSTEAKPKQFLPLIDEGSLFKEALSRVHDAQRFAAPIVVGSVRHADLCEQELRDCTDAARLVLEPCARNTAAAVIMAAAVAREVHGEDALLLVMPSDHVIEDVAAFHEAVRVGEAAARAGRLVTFGIRPSSPDTGFGYVEMGADLAGAPGVREVARFVEKPPQDAAEKMVAGGRHLWNAGIFLFQASTMLSEASALVPDIAEAAVQAVVQSDRDTIRITANERALADCRSLSIDYAVMENSSRVAVVPMSSGWSDLGSWDALASLAGGEVALGPVTTVDCSGCYIRSDGLEVAALGIEDLIIVASGGRLLIMPKGRSQEVKTLLSMMDRTAT